MRVIRESERFFKRVYEYCHEHNVEIFSVLFYVTLTPSILINDTKPYKRLISHLRNKFSLEPFASNQGIIMAFVFAMIRTYAKTGKFPTSELDSLDFIYSLIMRDFKQSTSYTFEEALQDVGDAADPHICARSWYIINAVLNNSNVEEVKQIIAKSIEEESSERGRFITNEDTPIHFVLNTYLIDPDFKSWFDKYLTTLTPELSREQMAKMLMGKLEGDKLVLPANLLEFFFAALNFVANSKQNMHKYEEHLELMKRKLETVESVYNTQLQLLVEELEQAQPTQTVKIEKIYVGNDDKIELLRQEYEAQIARLQDQLDMYRQLLKEATSKTIVSHKPLPFESNVEIAYFGMQNPALESKLKEYNVSMKYFVPYKPPKDVPDSPIVLNIDIASHAVWDKIKDRKPLIVSGSNADLLAERIVEWLHNQNSMH